MSDWLTSRPGGCSQTRELWFTDILMYIYIYLGGGNLFNFHGIVEQWSGREIGTNKVLDDHYSHVRVVELVGK